MLKSLNDSWNNYEIVTKYLLQPYNQQQNDLRRLGSSPRPIVPAIQSAR